MTEIALAVVHDRVADKVLLIKRSGSTDLQGWAFPGGKIEPIDWSPARGQTICRAARRELAEETGIVVNGCGQTLLTRTHPSTGVVVSYVYFSEDDLETFGMKPRRMEPSKAQRCSWMPRARIEELFESGFSEPVLQKMTVEADRAKTKLRRTRGAA